MQARIQLGPLTGRTKGGMSAKLHAETDAEILPIRFFMTACQVSDCTRTAALLGGLPMAKWLFADRGYEADWIRDALKDVGIEPCIPGRRSCDKPITHDKRQCKAAAGS
jgi:IS5 family transposase